jgi:hypothetical protein
MKRKAHQLLASRQNQSLLIRAPGAIRYPHADAIQERATLRQWLVLTFDGFTHAGLEFELLRSFAYLADDKSSWDAALALNEAQSRYDDPWLTHAVEQRNERMRGKIFKVWVNLPNANKARLSIVGFLPYESILDIDENGDDWFAGPHIYAPFEYDGRPFSALRTSLTNVATDTNHQIRLCPRDHFDNRIVFFSQSFVRNESMHEYLIVERRMCLPLSIIWRYFDGCRFY